METKAKMAANVEEHEEASARIAATILELEETKAKMAADIEELESRIDEMQQRNGTETVKQLTVWQKHIFFSVTKHPYSQNHNHISSNREFCNLCSCIECQ